MADFFCPQCGSPVMYPGAPCHTCQQAQNDAPAAPAAQPASVPNADDGQFYTFDDGSSFFGTFVDGKKQGWGLLKFADGGEYNGNFDNNTFDGFGILTFPSGAKYTGNFVNGMREGTGTFTFTDGAEYKGDWKNDVREGAGTLTLPDGAMYVGEWKQDKRSGAGKFTAANGLSYSGGFEDDEFHGGGMITGEDGSQLYVKYEHGTLVWSQPVEQAETAQNTAPAQAAPSDVEIWNTLLTLTPQQRNAFLASHPHIVIPNGVEFIPYGMFANCTYLQSVTFNPDLTAIGENAFADCRYLGPTLYIPPSVNRIQANAFRNCDAIEKVFLPDMIIVEAGAFLGHVAEVQFASDPPVGVVLGKGSFYCCDLFMSRAMK